MKTLRLELSDNAFVVVLMFVCLSTAIGVALLDRQAKPSAPQQATVVEGK